MEVDILTTTRLEWNQTPHHYVLITIDYRWYSPPLMMAATSLAARTWRFIDGVCMAP